jgi:1-acyl-sn-glycerol-3-phosphate acyltransferase
MRGTLRLWRAVGHAILGWLTILVVFPRLGRAQREARVQVWALKMLACMGIRLEVHGTPPAQGPLLLVANHLSWLDIVVMHAAHHCRFVAKSDVKSWPVIGTLSNGAGTLYIEREKRRDAMRVVHHMRESLLAGEIVAIFPEGTTSDGSDVLPFHANLIQAAVSVDAPVQPVGLRYLDRRTGRDSASPLYLGEQTLVASLWRTLSGPPILARVTFGEPHKAAGRDRRAWASHLRAQVALLREGSGHP